MKKFIKHLSALLALVSLLAVGMCLTGCSSAANSAGEIANAVKQSVTIPEQYSITYQVQTTVGEVYTVQKTVDGEGNVYYKNGSEELLFIREDGLYALYSRAEDGNYALQGTGAAYNETYVASATAEFLTYAERSLQQFLPTAENIGEQEVIGRNCNVYSVGVGTDDTGVNYSFYVDKETGICMGWEEMKSVMGVDLGVDGEVFTCTEFVVENVPALSKLIEK